MVVAALVTGATFGPLTAASGAATSIPSSEIPAECLTGDAVLIEQGHLVSDAAKGATRLTRDISAAAIEPGHYAVTLWSYDNHDPNTAPQLNEQWRLELAAGTELLYSSGPSADLDDLLAGATINATLVGADVHLAQSPDTLTAVHEFENETADGTANSVIAVCAVLTPIPDPIMVTKLVDADGDGLFQSSEDRAEGTSEPATYEVTVTNPAPSNVTVETLVDDRVGDLAGQGSCAVPVSIPPGGTYSCLFGADVPGQNAGAAYRNVVTATTSTGRTATAAADVVFADQAPSIVVTKSAVDTVAAPGAFVDFTVTVQNTSVATDPVGIESMVDDRYGSLLDASNPALQATTCTNAAIEPAATYRCTFTAPVQGIAGDEHVNTVTATVTDDEGGSASAASTHRIELTRGPDTPEPQVVLTDTETNDSPTITGEFTYIISFFNFFADVAANPLAGPTLAEGFELRLPAGVEVATAQGPETPLASDQAPVGECVLSAAESQTGIVHGVLGVLEPGEATECRLQVVANVSSARTVNATVTLSDTGGSDQEPTLLKPPVEAALSPPSAPPEEVAGIAIGAPDPPGSLAFTGIDPAAAIGGGLALVLAGSLLSWSTRPASRSRRPQLDGSDDG